MNNQKHHQSSHQSLMVFSGSLPAPLGLGGELASLLELLGSSREENGLQPWALGGRCCSCCIVVTLPTRNTRLISLSPTAVLPIIILL